MLGSIRQGAVRPGTLVRRSDSSVWAPIETVQEFAAAFAEIKQPALTRTCPHCAEEILAAARLCKHCKQPVDAGAGEQRQSLPAAQGRAPGGNDFIFSNPLVRVTRSRISFATGVDFPVGAISSVRLGELPNPKRTFGTLMALGSAAMVLITGGLGAIMLMSGSGVESAGCLGIVLAGLCLVPLLFGLSLGNTETSWGVFLVTSGRELQATFGDQQTMSDVARAIRIAIDMRG
jgi:hypothetical protein